jgi:DNA-binding SARP family transcriptional activator
MVHGVVTPPPQASLAHDYRILGRFEVLGADGPVDLGPPKQRAVLAVLLLEAGRVVAAERLVELLWGDAPKALASLQAYVSNLRRALEPGRRPRDPAAVLVTQAPGYRLGIDRQAVDALRFEDLVATGRELRRAGDPTSALAALEEALALWHGPPLPELAHEPFVVEASARLCGLRVTALSLAAEAKLDLGDHLGAVGLLEDPVSEHPLDERVHGLLALAHYRAGRQADALRAVDQVRRALAEAAGLDLGPELRALEHDLLMQSPGLDWQPPPPSPSSPSRPPTGPERQPAPALAAREGSFVGRDAELQRLEAMLSDAAAGRGGVAVVVGEPGIGKTRLAEELTHVATRRGFVTAWARCPESGAVPPFWPTTQLADSLRQRGAIAGPLVHPGADAGPPPPATLFALYQTVVDALRSTPDPLLCVVDDIQWADADSLRLLAHVAGELAAAPVLIVVTTRPLDDDTDPVLLDCLGALARHPGSAQLALSGLGVDAVTAWLGHRSDVAVPDSVASVVHERSGGNPLFVRELSELLAAEGNLADPMAVGSARSIPPGVQFVVRRRVSRLPNTTQRLLTVASVVGRTFDLEIVAVVAGSSVDDTLDALAPAFDAGLVVDDHSGGFRFSHALVADALAAEVNAARRARLHAATARALATRAGTRLGAAAALVAHHAHEGLLAGTVELAVEASTEAARLAAARFGYEDAAAHWSRVVATLERFQSADRPAQIDALCELASSRFRADLVDDATEAAVSAIEMAETIGDAPGMVRAASLLANVHIWPNQRYGEVDARVVAALERTVAVVAADDLATRATVLGAMAVELTYADRRTFDAVIAEATAAARACGDPEVLARVLLNVAGPLRPTQLAERRAGAQEVISLVAAHGLPSQFEVVARFNLALAHNESADLDAAAAEITTCGHLADRIGGTAVRAQLLFFRAALLLARGRYEQARRLGAEATELYTRTRRYDAGLVTVVLDASITADLGGLEALAEKIAEARAESPHYGRLSAEFSAWLLLENGHPEAAAAVVGLIDASTPFPDDYTFLVGACMGLYVRAELGDTAGVSRIMEQLEPYAGRWAAAGSGGCVVGLVDLALARGAGLLGDHARARRLFEEVVVGHERMRTPVWLARSLLHQGRFLLATGDAEDAAAGRRAIERATAIAEAHGAVNVVRQAADALTAG